MLPHTHTSAFLSGEVDPWEIAGDLDPEPELEVPGTARTAADAATETGDEEQDEEQWERGSMVSLASSCDSERFDCRASASDEDDNEDYDPLAEEELAEKLNRRAEK